VSVSNSCTGLELLADPPAAEWVATAPVVAVTSTEPFFVHHVLSLLRDRLCPDEEDRAWAWREFVGDDLEDGRDVFDEAATIPMFATATRAAVVRAADGFVTRFRETLEKLAGTPRGRRGVVILEVKSLPSNTKLAKAIAKTGVIVDTAIPPRANLASWLVAWTKSHHGRAIQKATAERLLDRLDGDLGQIDQAIARLAAAGGTGAIPPEAVDEIAMGPKERSAWEMVDLAASGRAAAAISHLADLIELAMPSVSSSTRRAAGPSPRASSRRPSIRPACRLVFASGASRSIASCSQRPSPRRWRGAAIRASAENVTRVTSSSARRRSTNARSPALTAVIFSAPAIEPLQSTTRATAHAGASERSPSGAVV